MSKTIQRSIADMITDAWPAMRMSDAAAADIIHFLGVLPEIAAERSRQDEKWGEQNHYNGTGPGFVRAADAARARCQEAAKLGLVTYRHILEEEVWEAFSETDPAQLRVELVQVAAVAVAWIEKLDREKAASTK